MDGECSVGGARPEPGGPGCAWVHLGGPRSQLVRPCHLHGAGPTEPSATGHREAGLRPFAVLPTDFSERDTTHFG